MHDKIYLAEQHKHININQSGYPLKILNRFCLLKQVVVSLSSYFHRKTDFINIIHDYFCKKAIIESLKIKRDEITIKNFADIADVLTAFQAG